MCRLPADAEIPDWAWSGPVQSVTRTADELSIICSADRVPDGVKADKNWQALKLAGPLDLTLVGVSASLSGTLAEAEISILLISTFDTDYILVRADRTAQAVKALRRAGHWVLTHQPIENSSDSSS